jgi:biopolymer transport protein ExbD
MARRRRKQSGDDGSAMNMSAMIDVVFQLLIFFMLTLKIVEPEGDFNVNMPAQGQPKDDSVVPPLDIKVKLRANPDGTLAGVYMGQRALGVGPAAFQTLNIEILKIIGSPGNDLTKDTQVEIDADYNLHFHNVINAVGACTGTLDKRTGAVIKYIEKIKFAPPKSPGAGA